MKQESREAKTPVTAVGRVGVGMIRSLNCFRPFMEAQTVRASVRTPDEYPKRQKGGGDLATIGS